MINESGVALPFNNALPGLWWTNPKWLVHLADLGGQGHFHIYVKDMPVMKVGIRLVVHYAYQQISLLFYPQ